MKRRIRWSLVFLAASLPLIYLAYRRIPLHELQSWLRTFPIVGLGYLVAFETAAWLLMGERWRFLCRETGASFSVWTAAAARLVGFAWSYITPGPHLGGEPVQINYLTRRGFPSSLTLPALIRDRGYEMLSGLITAALLILIPGGDRRLGIRSLIGAVCLGTAFAAPALHRPSFKVMAGAILRIVGYRRRRRVYTFLASTFRPAAARGRSTKAKILLSLSLLTAPALIIAELALFFSLSGTPIGWRGLLMLAAVSRISHYAPIPGAVGVYDAGIIGTAAWIQLDVGTAAAYVLITRLRDLIQVSGGLGMTISIGKRRHD